MDIESTIKKLFRSVGLDIRYYRRFDNFLETVASWGVANEVDGIIDVGANVGQYGNSIRGWGYHGNLFSFEPQSKAFAKLEVAAGKDPRWKTFHCAVGEKDGEATIQIARNSVSSSLLPMLKSHEAALELSEYVGEESVQLRSLSSLIKEGAIEGKRMILKIDAQGYEDQVLAGVTDGLDSIVACQMELSVVPLYEGGKTYLEMIQALDKQGFGLYTLKRGFTNRKTGQLLQADAFFIRKDYL